jgi:hypothetical protein
MPEILPIDANWKFQVCSVDGSGFKVAPPRQLKKTYYKNKGWRYAYVIIRWLDEDNEWKHNYRWWVYDMFSQDSWIECCNMWDWLYDGEWCVIEDGVTDDHKEVSAVIRKYMNSTTTHHEDVKYTL